MINRPDLRSLCPFNPYSLLSPAQSDEFEITKRTQPEICSLGNIEELANIREKLIEQEIDRKIRIIFFNLYDQILELKNAMSQTDLPKEDLDETELEGKGEEHSVDTFYLSNDQKVQYAVSKQSTKQKIPMNSLSNIQPNSNKSEIFQSETISQVNDPKDSLTQNLPNTQPEQLIGNNSSISPTIHTSELGLGSIQPKIESHLINKSLEQKKTFDQEFSHADIQHFFQNKNIDSKKIILELDEFFKFDSRFNIKTPANFFKLKMSYLKNRLMCKQGRLQERVFRGFTEQHQFRKISINPLFLPEIRMISNFSESYVLKEIKHEYQKKLEYLAIERRKNIHAHFKNCFGPWIIDKKLKMERLRYQTSDPISLLRQDTPNSNRSHDMIFSHETFPHNSSRPETTFELTATGDKEPVKIVNTQKILQNKNSIRNDQISEETENGDHKDIPGKDLCFINELPALKNPSPFQLPNFSENRDPINNTIAQEIPNKKQNDISQEITGKSDYMVSHIPNFMNAEGLKENYGEIPLHPEISESKSTHVSNQKHKKNQKQSQSRKNTKS